MVSITVIDDTMSSLSEHKIVGEFDRLELDNMSTQSCRSMNVENP